MPDAHHSRQTNMNTAIKPGRYRHFKGGEYEVIDVALHSETEQPHVVYRPLYGEGRLWIRPLELFDDQKQVAGRSVPRFERVGDRLASDTGPQHQVKSFCERHGLKAPTAARLLDLCAELGELAKEWLKSSAYGRQAEAAPDPERWQAELGDTLFALLCLANESGVDAEQALELALGRYQRRIETAGRPGSEGD